MESYIGREKLIDFLKKESDYIDRISHSAGESFVRKNEIARIKGFVETENDSFDKILPAITKPETIFKAIQKYGERAQVDIAIEEMSELTKALLKRRRVGDFTSVRNNIIDEIADVLICAKQLILIYMCPAEVQERIEYKLDRLERRMQEEKQ